MMADAVGARTDHLANRVHQDLLVHLVLKALQAVQEARAEMATVVAQVPQVLQAILVQQANKARLVIEAKMQLVDKKATPVPLVLLALQVDLAPTPKKEVLAEMEDPAHLVPLASLEQAVALELVGVSAHQAGEANPARMPNIVHAPIAPRPKPPKPRPKRKPRPKPKPRHKPRDNLVKIILSFDYLPRQLFQYANALLFIHLCFGWRFLGF